MSVKFTNTFIAEMTPALTIEDMYRKLAAYGGIQAFEFDSLVDTDRDGWNEADWTLPAFGWGAFGETLTVSANGQGGYSLAWHKQSLPTSFVLELDGGTLNKNTVIVFRGDGQDDFYAMRYLDGNVSFWRVRNSTWEMLDNFWYIGDALWQVNTFKCRLAVRQMMFSEADVDRWVFMSVWFDDRLVLSSYDHIPEYAPGLRWGLGVCDDDTYPEISWQRARVSDLCEILPWASIDPGESPLEGIQRAIADRVVKMFIRHDGTLRAFRPKPLPVSQVFTPSEESSLTFETDLRELYNHVRLYYSLDWVEVFDEAGYEAHGHRFMEMTNTYIEDENEALREAEAILRRMKEGAYRAEFRSRRGGALLEPEDRITLPNGEDYIIDSITLNYEGNGLTATIRARKYSWDD